MYLEVNNDEVEVGRSRLGLGFRSVSTLNERPVYVILYYIIGRWVYVNII